MFSKKFTFFQKFLKMFGFLTNFDKFLSIFRKITVLSILLIFVSFVRFLAFFFMKRPFFGGLGWGGVDTLLDNFDFLGGQKMINFLVKIWQKSGSSRKAENHGSETVCFSIFSEKSGAQK